MKLFLSTLLVVALAAHLNAQSAAKESTELAALKKSRQNAMASTVAPIDRKYQDALTALKGSFTKAGKLAEAVAVDEELQRLEAAKKAGLLPGSLRIPSKDNAPKEMTGLQQSWTKALTQAVSPIDKRYLDNLEQLKRRYSRDGRLDEALAVDQEIGRIPKGAETGNALKAMMTNDEFEQLLSGSLWSRPEGDSWLRRCEFRPKGLFVLTLAADERSFGEGWKILEPFKVEVGTPSMMNRKSYILEFSPDMKSFILEGKKFGRN